MSTKTATITMLGLAACYGDVRTGVTAPVGHGHGGAAFDVGLGLGVEHVDRAVRAGGGLAAGVRAAEGNGYIPLGADGHLAVRLSPYVPSKQFHWLGVVHAAVTYAHGLVPTDRPDAPEGPSGFLAQSFVGIGLGSTEASRDSKIERGHVAVGLVTSWFRPDAGGGFWFLGAALDTSIGWLQK